MSKELEIGAIFKLIDKVDKLNKLNEMEEMGAAPKDIEKLQDDIADLQMNAFLGDLFDEG